MNETVQHVHELISTPDFLKQFSEDIDDGLKSCPKRIPSHYFYDEAGSDLFKQITELPEYYLTNCENEILQNQSANIAQAICNDTPKKMNIIEFGAGDTEKPFPLISEFLRQNISLSYVAVDISESALLDLSLRVAKQFPDLQFKGLIAEYSHALELIQSVKSDRNLLLFLGSNIGNFVHDQKINFLQSIKAKINPGDYFLIGFDLKKHRSILLPAYDDSSGITRQFNLNLLTRINRELGGNFNIDKFSHYAKYNPVHGAMESYLISDCTQEVYIETLNQTYKFTAKEAIQTESSHKYGLNDIAELAAASGFHVVENFFDSKKFFVCSLWQA